MGAAKTKEVKGAVSIHNNRQSKRLVLDRRRSCSIEGQLDKRIIIFTNRSLSLLLHFPSHFMLEETIALISS